MEEENNLKESFEAEIEKYKDDTILSPEYRRKKMILWLIRTIIAVILFIVFWEYKWVRWGAILYIPLNLFSLFSIYGFNKILNRKMNRTMNKIDESEDLIESDSEE